MYAEHNVNLQRATPRLGPPCSSCARHIPCRLALATRHPPHLVARSSAAARQPSMSPKAARRNRTQPPTMLLPAAAIATVVLLFVVCTAADAIKCDSPLGCISLWPGIAPNETHGFPGPESRAGNDGTGCGAGHNIACDHIYNVSVPTLTPFIVTNGTGAAVVIAPGGGYSDLSWGKEGLDTARMYNAMGVSAFVLKYRVPARPAAVGLPHWWAPLQDAQRAVGIVRAGAAKWGLNASRIGFTGFSAGGHLTAHISTAWRERIYPR